MKNKSLQMLGFALTLAVTVTGCGSTEKTEAEKANVEVMTPGSGEVALDTDYIGTVSPEQQIYVVPLVSGTVTEANYSVGDTVKEGDVLFKIDDEAAQLQMDNAKASYSQAQAGVTAATGGARHLQNYQTERGIDTIEDNLDTARNSVKDLESQIDTLKTQETQLSQSITAAQANVEAKSQAVQAAQEALKQYENSMTQSQSIDDTAIAVQSEAGNDTAVENGENTSGTNEASTATNAAASNSPSSSNATTTPGGDVNQDQNSERQKLQDNVTAAQAELEAAQSALAEAQSGLSSVQSGKSQLESALETAKAQKDSLKESLKTSQETYEITKNEVYPETDATYSAQLSQANVALESAQYQLDMYTIKAPITGQIESISVEKDALASAGSPAYVISNKDSMTVTFYVSEKVKDELQVGDAVEVERDDETFAGTITEVGTMAGAQTRLFEIKATVIGANDSLPSGVSVKVHATTEREQSGLVIPYDAVYFSAGDAYVYCVEDGKLVKTPITVGLMNDDEVSVEDGLNGESQVVTTWSSKLRDGAEVVISGASDVSEDSQKEAEGENAESSTESEDAE